ncbi:hypothetical protein ACSLBF_12790 [Pseudoalteromonas sp. T1lg65]|uniref:hypothetical protein n=1 Tax=Pseudoalteromonas sp. T1lg65 TaxID=2077101 RepID=UPI003F78F2BA
MAANFKKLILKKSVLKNIISESSLKAVFGGTIIGDGNQSSTPQQQPIYEANQKPQSNVYFP